MPRISIVRDDGVVLSNIDVDFDSIRQLSITGDQNGEPVVQAIDVDIAFNPTTRMGGPPTTLDEVHARAMTEAGEMIAREQQGRYAGDLDMGSQIFGGPQGLGATMMFMPNRATNSYYHSRAEVETILHAPDPIVELKEMMKQFEIMLRAETLLFDVLGQSEYEKYKEKGFVPIASKIHPGREYQVAPYGRVKVFEEGKKVMELCINPVLTDLPEQDTIVTKKLSLEADEAEFLRTAVAWHTIPGYRDPEHPRNSILDRLYRILERAQ